MNPLIIAGPCAAETEEQLRATAAEIVGVFSKISFELSYFRAGVWKPRSTPSGFAGAGEPALRWLKNLQNDLHLRACVEVATPKHIDLCAQHDITAVWIGARTAVNPFSVQTLADALKGSDFTVMLKNPAIADEKLWQGGIERLLNADVKKVIAVHRGFAEINENIYRNAPLWEIPIALKLHFPEVPLLCDPSHICGDSKHLRQISQSALDWGFDGLMVETHHAPAHALTDQQQQISPTELGELLQTLVFKSPLSSPAEEELRKCRNRIDHIDTQLAELLARRMSVVDNIAQIKSENNLPLVQPQQWNKVVNTYLRSALPDDNYSVFIQKFLDLLHQQSIERQKKER